VTAIPAIDFLRASYRRRVAALRNAPWFGRAALHLVRVAGDVAAVLLAFALVYRLYVEAIRGGLWVWETLPPHPGAYAVLAGLFAIVSLAVFWYLGLYRARASVLNLWELQTAAKGVGLAGALFFCLLFFLKMEGYSRAVVVSAIIVALVLVVIERRLLSALARRLQLQGTLGRRTLIYGCGTTGQLLMKKIVQASHLGSSVVGFIDDLVPLGNSVSCRITQTGTNVFRSSVVGRFEELKEVVSRYAADELLVAASLGPARLREVLDFCRQAELEVGVVPRLIDARPDDLVVEDLSAIPVLRPRPRRTTAVYRVSKRLLDLLVAAIVLVVTSPLWILAAALVRLDSPGPVFFVQERIGLKGRRFRILKFRTMGTDTPPYDHSPVGDIDPRITPVGRILRVGGFDELPQLINVLRGDMSMVGPRPEMPFIVAGYTDQQRLRLDAKPGITGLWQVSADRHSEIHENIEYDLYYIKHQSILLDILVLVETVLFTGGVIIQSCRRRPRARAGSLQPLVGISTALRESTVPGATQGERTVFHATDARDS
jgi:exopolysaccharide biosynthesis polyprenyl glycosylphosphotransferase